MFFYYYFLPNYDSYDCTDYNYRFLFIVRMFAPSSFNCKIINFSPGPRMGDSRWKGVLTFGARELQTGGGDR